MIGVARNLRSSSSHCSRNIPAKTNTKAKGKTKKPINQRTRCRFAIARYAKTNGGTAKSQIARFVSQKPIEVWPQILFDTYCSSFQLIKAKPIRLIGKLAKIRA